MVIIYDGTINARTRGSNRPPLTITTLIDASPDVKLVVVIGIVARLPQSRNSNPLIFSLRVKIGILKVVQNGHDPQVKMTF